MAISQYYEGTYEGIVNARSVMHPGWVGSDMYSTGLTGTAKETRMYSLSTRLIGLHFLT